MPLNMIAYKLFRLRKDGTLGSLFVNRRAVLPPGYVSAGLHASDGANLPRSEAE